MRLSDLKKMERTIDVAFGPLAVRVTYGMDAFVGSMAAETIPFLLLVLKRWDLTDDDGATIPIDAETLRSVVPYPFLQAVEAAVQRDARPGNASGAR
jgi:hypothetical protein